MSKEGSDFEVHHPAQSCSGVGVEVLSPSSSLLFRHALWICPILNPEPHPAGLFLDPLLSHLCDVLFGSSTPSFHLPHTCPDPGPGLGSCEGSGGDSVTESRAHPAPTLSLPFLPTPAQLTEQFLLELEPMIRID